MVWEYVSRSRTKDTSNPFKDTASYLRRAWEKPGVYADAAYHQAFRIQCAEPPGPGGRCLSPRGAVGEVYGKQPIKIQVQIWYFNGVDRKGHWYKYKYTGSTSSPTYRAWDTALNAATATSNVDWVVRKWDKPWNARGGYAPGNVMESLFDDAYALTRPVLLKKIALRNQKERKIQTDLLASITAQEKMRRQNRAGKLSPFLIFGVAAGAYLLYQRA